MTTTDPQTNRWKVTRPLLAWRPRWRRLDLDSLWPTEWDDVGALVLGAFLLVASLFAVVLIPAVILVFELSALLAIAPFQLTWRLLARRWKVLARQVSGDPRERIAWHVRGLRRSTEVKREVAAAIAAGRSGVVPEGTRRVDGPLVHDDRGLPMLPSLGEPR